VFQLTLPNDDDFPPVFFELLFFTGIPGDILGEFIHPILGVMLGDGQIATRTTMPEAPVDKDGDLAARIADVWTAGDLPLKTVTSFSSIPQGLS